MAGQYAKIYSTRMNINILVKLSWPYQYGGESNEIIELLKLFHDCK